MDRQCKKTTDNLHMDRQCKKTALEHLQCSRQCKKNNSNLHMDSTYLQTVQKTMCRIHIHILSTHSVLLDILSYQLHIIHRMYTFYIMYTLYIVVCEGAKDYTLYSIFVQQYRLVVQQIVVQRCNRLFICNVVDVHCMVSSDSR